MNERIEIQLSKKKNLLALLGAAAFVAAGFILPGLYEGDPKEELVMVTSYAAIIFFGLCGLYILVKLFDSKPGLILDSEGIHDNSSAVAADLIRWKEIKGIEVDSVLLNKFIRIDLKDPEALIARHTGVKKWLMQMNYKQYDSPAFITSSTLNCKFTKLEKLLKEKLKQYS